jgi:hypothetical protein
LFRRHAVVIVNPAVIPEGAACESLHASGMHAIHCAHLAVAAVRIDGVARFVCARHIYGYIPQDTTGMEAI